MLSFILFFIGIALLRTGKARVDFFGINADGDPVRTAGKILIFPFAFSFLLAFVVGWIIGDDPVAFLNTVQTLACLELIILAVAMRTAYKILKQASVRPINVPPVVDAPPAPMQPQDYPSVVTVEQAAQYLNLSPEKILAEIEAGNIPAARMNTGYRIARSVLDDYRHNNAL